MKLLVGADPELWIFDNKLGKIISAHGLFPGTKEEPFRVTHGAIQVDGMAAEYNIDPASNENEFVYYNISVLCDLRDKIKELNPDLDFDFRFVPVAEFGAEYIAEQPEIARRLGCTPDFNAYENGNANPTPDADMPFRTSSGHFHLGWTKDQDINDPEFIEACCMMVKQLDTTVGTRAAFYEGADGVKRRELYGKAGAFRPKSYGVEYRTASSNWLNNVDRMTYMYQSIVDSFDELLAGHRQYEMIEYEDTRDAINTGVNIGLFQVHEYIDNYSRVDMTTLDTHRNTYARLANRAANNRNEEHDPFNVDDGPMFDEDDELDFDDFEPNVLAAFDPADLEI